MLNSHIWQTSTFFLSFAVLRNRGVSLQNLPTMVVKKLCSLILTLMLAIGLSRTQCKAAMIFGTANGVSMVIESDELAPGRQSGWMHSIGCTDKKFPGRGLWTELDFERKKITLSESLGSNKPVALGDIQTEEITFNGIKLLKFKSVLSIGKSKAILEGSTTLDPLNDFQLFRYCPDAGWEPGELVALVNPSHKASELSWLKEKDWTSEFIKNEDDHEKNVVNISVPVGFEYEAIADLRKREAFLDVTRVARAAGPDDVTLEFPFRSVISTSTTINDVKAKVEKLTRALFSAKNAVISPIELGKGYSFSLLMQMPVASAGISGFEGWWVKFKLNLLFDRVLEPDGQPIDRITIQIPDGYLAKWSETQKSPPPMGHYDHLLGEEESRFKNFSVLMSMQEKIGTRIKRLWN